MKLLKIMPAALLLTLSIGAYAQDEDETLDAVNEEESTEVFVPTTPIEKPIFHRVQLGFTGTNVKYTNFGLSPDYNNFFLKGVSLGYTVDLRTTKRIPLYLELGATLAYHTARSKGDSLYIYHSNLGGGEETTRHYRIHAFTLTIPVSLSYQFKNVGHVEGLTLAPFAGLYARFNIIVDRAETTYMTEFSNGNDGKGIPGVTTVSRVTKTMMSDDKNGGWCKHKPHTGKLLQCGVQVGVSAYYKRYTLGVSYMRDLMPFSSHSSSPELTSKTTAQGGNLPSIGTNCDEKVSTANNFAITVGYVF